MAGASSAAEARPSPDLRDWSSAQFGELVEPHRRELLVHCYRMLGSVDDAEDVVQETFTRAWDQRETFRDWVSPRAWLYRIATNACISTLRRLRARPAGELRLDLQPIPDSLLPVAGLESSPEARFDAHEAISLAFLHALQVLPARQRAVLLLRDVLGWPASEVATLLGTSVPAANSALQRARATLDAGYRASGEGRAGPGARGGPARGIPAGAGAAQVLERYVRAWETADIAGLVRLLRDDAVLAMPPLPSLRGAAPIGAFLAANLVGRGHPARLLATRANDRPAFGFYLADRGDGNYRAFSILVLEIEGDHIARIDAYTDASLFEGFGLPPELAA